MRSKALSRHEPPEKLHGHSPRPVIGQVLSTEHPKHEGQSFPNNTVSTSKYTLLTFIPRYGRPSRC
jgi:hypothetical protein